MTDHPRFDLRDQLQATLGTAVTLEHELTGGAMSRVFAAKDATLDRRIVVKVLSPELAEGVSADRFAREIRIAASLQQANIVPVLATGETNGLPYYTMPFVDGLSLREKLRKDGKLSIRDAASTLRDVARALAFAHERGVVHRDIKPENVLLSGESAVVTDFGIAKAITAARTTAAVEGAPTELTRAGIALGTPAYMAPEQISGEIDVDHRVDIYAFGCMAYELISGAPPFRSRPERQLFAAHLTEVPTPLTEVRPDCPSTLSNLVMRCLAKDPGDRPQSARELLAQLDVLGTPRQSSAWRSLTARQSLGALGLVAAILVSAALLTADRSGSTGDTKSIAVLPLTNVGGDSAQEYLADGMTDELSNAFGKLPGVRVASRSLARRYGGQRDLDVRDAGRALGVDYVLQGTVRRVGDKLRVSAQLTHVDDGVELWSDSYDRRADEVFAVQDDVTRGVATTLGLDERAAGDVRGTSDAEAYDLYLRGQYLLQRRGPGVRQAAEHFERAIARDGGFARAHAGLAAALELLPYFAETPARDVRDRATAAARRALELDSSLAEAHTALGLALMHAFDWQSAGAEFKRSVEVEPEDASAHHQYGRFLVYIANYDSALAEFRRAKTIDPFSSLYSAWVAATLSLQNQIPEAAAEARRALELDTLNPVALQVAGRVFLNHGDLSAARSAARRLPDITPWNGGAAFLYARLGDREVAQRMLRSLQQKRPRSWFGETAIAYAALGLRDTSVALSALERATDIGEIWPSFWAVHDPLFDPIRGSARFAALLRRVRLADQQR